MNDERSGFVLTSRDADAATPVLMGVQANGRLDAVLFELTLRQTYRNQSDDVLEVVYTFPLPHQAVLLGFASELNGERQAGTIVAKREAERQYEESLADGDAPVMLEALADGMHTANVGNLKPGDEIVLEVRFAQLLAFEQGRLRVAIPTTIAPRYGHAERTGLQPQQVPQASLEAEYPLSLSVTLGGASAGAHVACPSHGFTLTPAAGEVRLDLAPGAWLDGDVVVVVTPREPRPSLVVRANDSLGQSAPVVMMAALQPPAGVPRERIAVKLLVDCSGSMGGDSIESARAALRGVVAGLTDRDRLSLSRFGSSVEHLLAPAEASPRTLRHLLPLVDAIAADLGGTEMEQALRSVFELPAMEDAGGADVLMITDGEIWQADAMIAAARSSGHRVFAIGVGSSPAEGVLRSLAEATGGACEFATPGEALEAAARRMLSRMRQPLWRNVRVDWGSTPAWESGPPACVFGGDTVIAFAGFTTVPQAPAIHLLGENESGDLVELAHGEAEAPCPGDALARIAAAGRIGGANDTQALALALSYQLMGKQTNCILVHQRAETDKATEAAELHRVSSMLAAGWGATSLADMSVAESASAYPASSMPMFSRRGSSTVDSDIHFSLASPEDFDIPAFLRKETADLEPASLEVMARAAVEHLIHGGQLQGLAAHCAAVAVHPEAQRALDEAVALGVSLAQAWLLLAQWTNSRPRGLADASIAATLQPYLLSLDPDLIERCSKLFDNLLGGYPYDGWTLSRVQRLRHALGRALP